LRIWILTCGYTYAHTNTRATTAGTRGSKRE
jgi:hypothetical protein